MQFTGTVGRLTPGGPHAIYIAWDLALRRKILESLGEIIGVPRLLEPPPRERTGDNDALIAKLADLVGRIEPASPLDASHKEGALEMLEWLGRSDALGAEMRARDLADITAVVGRSFDELPEAELALEAYVNQAGPEEDEALLRLFGRMEARRMHMFSTTALGQPAVRAKLTPTR